MDAYELHPLIQFDIERLGFSNGYNLLLAIALGYPDESPAARPRKSDMVKYVE